MQGQEVKLIIQCMLFGCIFLSFWFGLLIGGGIIPTLWTLATIGGINTIRSLFGACKELIHH